MDREGEPSETPLGDQTPWAAPDPSPSPWLSERGTPSALELVADLAPPGALAAALKSVREDKVDIIDALMASVDGDRLVRRLGSRLGIATLTDGDKAPAMPALDARDAAEALRGGLLRLSDGRIAVVARGAALRRLVAALRGPVDRHRIVLATPRRFAALVLAASGDALVAACRDLLEQHAPHLSAHPLVMPRTAALAFATMVALAVGVLIWAPPLGHAAVSLFFLLVAGIRLVAASRAPLQPPTAPAQATTDLPVYTIVVPLYREGRALPGLLDALAALDYPALGSKCTKRMMALRRPITENPKRRSIGHRASMSSGSSFGLIGLTS